MKNKNKSWVVTAALAFVLVLVMVSTPFSGAVKASAPESSAPTPKAGPYGGVFKIGFQSDMKGLNPCVVNDVWSWNVIGFVYDTLGGTSKQTQEPIPWTAESWEETSTDHLNWTVHLRQNVKWHDGQPLTADDVVFSYNFLMDVGRYVSSLESVDWTPLPGATDKNETYYEGVQKVDDYTIKFKLARTNPTVLLDVMGIPLLPKHIWRNHWDDKTSWNMDYNPTTGEANVIGSGPFKFKYWKQGVEIRIERNADYFWEATLEDGNTYKVPFVDAIQFVIYKNMDAMVTALKQGVIDFIWWSIDPGWVPVVSQIPGTTVFANADRGYYYLMFNMILPFEGYDTGTGYQVRDDENSPISYPNPQGGEDAGLPFRKAVSHCIDKEYIVTRLLQGFGTKGDSIVPPAYTYWYNDTLPQYPYNIDTAKQILDQANYKDVNSDSWREDYAGRTMDGPNHNGQIDILTPPADYDPIRAESGKQIASAMKQAGIKAESVPTSFGQIVDSVFVYRDFEMFILGWSLSLDPSWVYDFFNTKFDWNNPDIGDGGNNAAGYRNQHYDDISSQVMSEMDPAKRVALVKECQGMIAQHLPTNVLYYRQVLNVADTEEWTGYHDTTGGIGNGWTLMEIHHPLSQPPLRVDVKAFPATMPGTKNATLQLTVSAVKQDGSAYPGVSVKMSLEPTPDSAYIGLDADQKTTDANGKAVFTVICKDNYPQDTVFKAVVNATDGTNYANANTYFTISMAGLNVEVTSPTIVEGVINNVFYLNVTVKQFTTPISGAQVEFQTLSPSDNLKNTLVRINTDANGTASLSFNVLANFTASTPVELKFTVWPAGGAKTLYKHNFVVLAQGGNAVDVAVDTIGSIKGLPGTTKDVNVTVTSGGNPLAGASVYGYVSPADKGLSVVQTDAVDTGTDGKATFTLKVVNLITLDTEFKFVAVVASGTYAGYTTAQASVPAVTTLNASVNVNPATITGNVGQSTTVKVTVTSDTTPIEGATVSLDISPATTALEVSPSSATTGADGIAQFTVSVKSAITTDTTYTITAHATYSTLSATGNANLQVNAGENINVEMQLSKTEVAGITGAEVTATVTVMNGTTPMANVDVSLVLNPSTGLSAETGKKTGTDGKATIKITVTQDFSADATVSVKAVATIGSKTYESAGETLTVKYVPYAVTVALDKTSVDGNKDTIVNATVTVKNGTTPMSGINVTLSATPSTNIEITPATATTDANGTAVFSVKLTDNFQADTSVSIEPKATIDGVDYTGAATTLSIKGIAAAYTVTLTLEKTQIDGAKDTVVKATIIVKSGATPVPNLTVTVTFDKSGLSATTATTDADGKAEVTITLTQDFTTDTTVKVTPKVAGQEYANSAVNLTVKAKATTTTPGFELLGVIAAIALVAGILVYTRRKDH